MRRIVCRELPDGSIRNVQPFHISLEGLEKAILCRDDTDYDAMVKVLCVSARRKNVILVIYAVVSNHCHAAVLAASQKEADAYGQDVKKVYSMWFNRRHGGKGILQKVDIKALCLDSDWYVRNALAYIPRNALDNGCNINEYRWSGYRAMFCRQDGQGREVASLSKRERIALLHTGDRLDDVAWRIDGDGCLIPSSICDHTYLEQAFENDQAFFLKVIGNQNVAEMQHKLVEGPRRMQPDSDYYKTVEEISLRWFQTPVSDLSLERKIRLVPYLYRTTRTTVPQLARILGLDRARLAAILGKADPGAMA